MKVFQLQLDGKDRGYHNFKTEDEAAQHQDRLLRYTKDRILEGQYAYQSYLLEIKNLEIVELEIPDNNRFFSVIETVRSGQSIVKSFNNEEHAKQLLSRITEDTTREYYIMESRFNHD